MSSLKDLFFLDPKIIFLNHGYLGATPKPIFDAYKNWQELLERQPVRFMIDKYDDLLQVTRKELSLSLHTCDSEIVFIPNTTFGVNAIARSLKLKSGDEILATNHEYTACDNIWEFMCKKTGAVYIRHPINLPITSHEEVIRQLWNRVTDQTKMIFISHISSNSAMKFPVDAICKLAKASNIMTFVDGAHAPGQIPLNIRNIGADFYVGSLSKWFLGPNGSAFLYSRKGIQHLVEPLVVSWGWGEDLDFSLGSSYLDYFHWMGTMDPAAYLAVSDAIKFQEKYNWDCVRERSKSLLNYALSEINEITGLPSLYNASETCLPHMGVALLPAIKHLDAFQNRLYDEYSIEIPCIEFNDHQLIRLSVQGYNTTSDIEKLIDSLKILLPIYI